DVPSLSVQRNTDRVCSRFHWNSHSQEVVDLVLALAVDVGTVSLRLHRKQLHAVSVQPQIDVVLDIEATYHVSEIELVPLQADLERILPIQWKDVPNCQTTP